MLLVAAADRLGVIERQTDLVLPKRQRRRRMIGGKADIDAGFCQFHRGFPCPVPGSIPGDGMSRNYARQPCTSRGHQALPCFPPPRNLALSPFKEQEIRREIPWRASNSELSSPRIIRSASIRCC